MGNQGNQVEAGGWNPVFRKRQMGNQGNRSVEKGLYTIFVDELPDSMTPRSLFTLFNNFGVVKDAFIPAKRRKATGSRFGFVRYDCNVAAEMAVLKTDGLWCDNKALKVKKAEFKKGEIKRPAMVTRGNDRMMQRQQRGLVQQGLESVGRRSFAEVVQNGGSAGKAKRTVKAYETGNGWLYDSIIVKLKSILSFNEFKEEVARRGAKDVTVRAGGGRLAVITFSSQQHKKEARQKIEKWLVHWCDFITDWEKGIYIAQERCVWITCVGVPFNLWNVTTFSDIGKVWGEVVQIGEDILSQSSFQSGKVRIITNRLEFINEVINVECNGNIFPVRVCEELPAAVQPCHCNSFCFDNVGTESMGQEEVDQLSKNGGEDMVGRVSGAKEKSNEWLSASAVKETGGAMGTLNVSEVGREANQVHVVIPRNEIQIVDGPICNPEKIPSSSGPESPRPKVNLEVILKVPQAGVLANGPITEPSNLSDCIAQTHFRPHDLLPAAGKVIEIGTTSRKGQSTKPR
ncbi:uncharacterized protein LOC114264892 [Camellia sinensis]|uniref:uncharacterized protein LOC114264892 n=1 Tax=Camellia sinensis TaxID=4442 RepID=UPI0010363E4E|nr:uncharacterized protein LOC114264892 [Camellia sinensis]